MHKQSASLQNTLDDAEYHYEAAIEALPNIVSTRRKQTVPDSSFETILEDPLGERSRGSSIRLSAGSEGTFASDLDDLSTPATSVFSPDETFEREDKDSNEDGFRRLKNASQKETTAHQSDSISRVDHASPTSDATDDRVHHYVAALEESQRREQINNNILAFRSTLLQHIDAVQQLRRDIEESESKRSSRPDLEEQFAERPYRHEFTFQGRKFALPKPQGAFDIAERIRQGRERGWERKRFDATRYRKLCTTALEELYV